MHHHAVAVVAITALVALAGCSSTGSAASSTAASPAAPSGPAASAFAATIEFFFYNPTEIHVKVGETVTWTNLDPVAHTVTLDDNSVDSGEFAKNGTFTHAFTKAGTYEYHCETHKAMAATLVVGG
jgi:plastocyanin